MPRPAKRPRPQDAREQQRDAAASVLERSAYSYGGARAAKVEACARAVRAALLEAPPRPAGAPAKLMLCAPKGLKNEHAACAFEAPSKVSVVGSWLLRTGLKRGAEMDLAVELPDALVTIKDLANGRYLAKRAAYLDHCAEVLREAGYQVTKVAFQRDARRPILEVADNEGGAVKVMVAWQAPAKARTLLGPARNNVRAADGSCVQPTPAYNAALLGDAALDRHLQLLHGACSADAAIVDAAVLLKARRGARITTRRRRLDGVAGPHTHRSIRAQAWLRAEDQLHRDDGPSGFLASMVAYHCASSVRPPDRIDAALSLFRDSLKFLAGNEWSSSQVTLRGASSADVAWPLPSLVDGDINLAASLSLAAAAELSDCATRALEAIRRDAPPGAFSLLFTPRKRQYDLTVKVPLLAGDDAYAASLATDEDDTSILGLTIPQAVGRRVCATVERALAGRLRRPPRWDCAGDSITIGASLSTDAWRQVLKGGAPSTDEGRSFRAFWGDRCQARRFKDGRVLEAVVWEPPQNCVGDGWKRLLPQRSLAHALARHEPRRPASLDGAPPGLLRDDAGHVGDARTAFEALATVLRKGDGPLRVDHASPCSSNLRGTSWRVIRANAKSGVLDCIDGVVRFAPSDAWEKLPSEARDAASLSLLAKMVPDAQLFAGDDTVRPHLFVSYRGYAMRLAPRLITRKSPRSDDLAHLHHSLLRSLATKQPSMPDACRLLVRWCHAQWLSDYVQQEHLELICAAAFAPLAANSGVGEVAAAARAGFVACLRVLATHDFSNAALYVDLRRCAEESRPASLSERASLVGVSQRIAADYADDVEPCVAAGALARDARLAAPEAVVWHLLVDGARSALQSLEDDDALWGSQGGKAARQAAGAFVVLRGDVVGTGDDVRGPRALRPRESFRNLGDADAGAFVQEGPADAFARKCREAFGDVALFLRDAREPKRMAVVWRPGFDGDARQVLRAVAALGVSVVKRVEVVG